MLDHHVALLFVCLLDRFLVQPPAAYSFRHPVCRLAHLLLVGSLIRILAVFYLSSTYLLAVF